MKVQAKELQKAVSLAGRFCNKSSPIEIYKCVLLSTNQDGLVVEATDAETQVKCQVEANLEEGDPHGRFAATPQEVLENILRHSPKEEITLGWQNGHVALRHSLGEHRITSIDPSEYPFTEYPDQPLCRISVSCLQEAVRLVYPCADSSWSSRAALTAILFSKDGDTLKLVATDGRILGCATCKAVELKEELEGFLVPAYALNKLVGHLAPGEVDLCLDENSGAVLSERLQMGFRLIQGEFPDWKKVIPDYHTEPLVPVARELFVSALRQISKNDDEVVSAVMQVKDGTLLLESEGINGRSQISICVPEDFQFPKARINVALMLKLLSGIQDTVVSFVWKTSDAPIVVKAHQESNPSFLGLIMPMQL